MDWENVLAKLIETVCSLVITIGLPCLIKAICAKTNNDHLNKLIELASQTIEKCVITIDQIYVDGLKKEGKFTKELQEEAFDTCKCMILNTLSEDTKNAVITMCGDLDSWIRVNIESYVRLHSSQKN